MVNFFFTFWMFQILQTESHNNEWNTFADTRWERHIISFNCLETRQTLNFLFLGSDDSCNKPLRGTEHTVLYSVHFLFDWNIYIYIYVLRQYLGMRYFLLVLQFERILCDINYIKCIWYNILMETPLLSAMFPTSGVLFLNC